jgi:hypothetical protein
MNDRNSFKAEVNQKEFTSVRNGLAQSTCYPLCESGPLCPILDDEDLLFDFYIVAGMRQHIKRFFKTNRWEGKPQVRVMTDSALKNLLQSVHNSPEARRMLITFDKNIALHQAIWGWLKIENKTIYDIALSFCHQDEKGKCYMSPSELGQFLEKLRNCDSPTKQTIIYLALAFAMLEKESSIDLITEVVIRYPETMPELGLFFDPVDQSQQITDSITEPETQARSNAPLAIQSAVVSAEIIQTTLVNSVECWVPLIDDVVRKVDAIDKSYELFAKNAEQLATIQELTAFMNSGDVPSLLSSLELERKHIADQCRDIELLLSLPCNDADVNGCELQQFLRQLQDKPATTPHELVCNAGGMRKKADALVESAQFASKEFIKLTSKKIELMAQIGSSDQILDQPEQNIFPCRIIQAASKQREVVDILRLRLLAEVNIRKDQLNAECDQLDAKYSLSICKTSSDYSTIYADLTSRIASARDIQEIEACRIILNDLTALCHAIGHYNLHELAGRLKEEPGAFPIFMDLCRTLIDQDAPEVAFLLLHLRQHLHPFEEISELTDQALSILLESACAATLADLPSLAVWNSFCEEPWLLSIGRDDIESPDLHERIVIALMGLALKGYAERASSVLVNVGAAELSRQSFSDVLYRVIQAIIARRPIKIAGGNELTAIREQACKISERIAFESGKYRHLQCGNATHFARFEAMQIFPTLTELWSKIHSDLQVGHYGSVHATIAKIQINDWYEELIRKHDKQIIDHPLFSGKIRGYMAEFLNCIQEHVNHCEKVWGADQFVVAEDELTEALKQWAGTQKGRCALITLILKNQMLPISENFQNKSLWNAVAQCKPMILRCPHFVPWLRAQQNPEPDLQLEQLILEDLVRDYQFEEVTRILEEDSAWEQLGVLYRDLDVDLERNWIKKYQRDLTQLSVRREEVLANKTQSLIESFDACIQDGRFHAATQILESCGKDKAKLRAQELEVISSFVNEQFKIINAIKDVAADVNMPEEWQEAVFNLAAKIERQLRNLRRSDETGDVIGIMQIRLTNAIEALNFVVNQRTQIFDEVEHHLQLSQENFSAQPITTNDRERAIANCPDIHKHWNTLASSDPLNEDEKKRAWLYFVKAFAKICNLYHDESDEKRRFVTVPSINYPFVVYHTAFYKPQSEFLKRPLRLYLYRQSDVDIAALQRLEAELSSDNSAAWLHVVFAPEGVEKIRRYFKYDKGFKNFLLVDESFLYQLSLVEKHDVPVRQALHASVTNLASSSPFVAQGYCHQSNNIYVGRKDILQKLLNTPQAMIWGGRRIGKTSVLHALENVLGKRNYSVAYVYVDLEDNGDPDLSIAQKIAATLKLPNVASITDFERQITSLRNNGTRIAFLIDEVDEYIKKSRKVHADNFPLATALRQLVMDDAAKDTILVYSGYHQLYYEAKLNKDKRRVGHPFINIAQDVPIRDLTHDDVNELVKTGFEEMLDIRISPEVPPLIFRRASGHPAFVQQFCRCLLERVSKRRSPDTTLIITKDDVEAVYSADVSKEGGEQPFILYVNETLGYNLSHLGRAIMLAICLAPSAENQTENEDGYFSIQKIKEELNVWCEVIGVKHPEPDHFQQSIELLVMTNMLTQNPQKHDKYRVTYPTHIDILRRLDKLRKADVEHSLREYDIQERMRGVLL